MREYLETVNSIVEPLGGSNNNLKFTTIIGLRAQLFYKTGGVTPVLVPKSISETINAVGFPQIPGKMYLNCDIYPIK
jgi:hypothetical protein